MTPGKNTEDDHDFHNYEEKIQRMEELTDHLATLQNDIKKSRSELQRLEQQKKATYKKAFDDFVRLRGWIDNYWRTVKEGAETLEGPTVFTKSPGLIKHLLMTDCRTQMGKRGQQDCRRDRSAPGAANIG